MNRIALDLGFIQIYWYSIMVLLGLLFGLAVIYFEMKKQKINIDFFTNLAFYTIIVGIICARLYYVLFNLDYYGNHILEIFEIWNGGLAIHGGIIGGGLFALYYCHKYKVKFLRITDIALPGLILAQGIGRWGNFFNSEAHGVATTFEHLKSLHIPEFVINGMYINGSYYLPTFLYESVWNIIGFIVLIILRRVIKNLKLGQLSGIYMIWYSIGRIYIEGLRTDSLMLGNIRIAQLVSVVFIIIGILLIIRGFLREGEELYRTGQKEEIKY